MAFHFNTKVLSKHFAMFQDILNIDLQEITMAELILQIPPDIEEQLHENARLRRVTEEAYVIELIRHDMQQNTSTASRFLKELCKVHFKSEVAGSSIIPLFLIFGVYLLCKYGLPLKSDQIIPAVFIICLFYTNGYLIRIQMSILCPNCNKRFFSFFKKSMFPVHVREKCCHCGITLKEIEDTAGEQLDIIQHYE